MKLKNQILEHITLLEDKIIQSLIESGYSKASRENMYQEWPLNDFTDKMLDVTIEELVKFKKSPLLAAAREMKKKVVK